MSDAINAAEQRGKMIKLLEDGTTPIFIERALDEARSQQFTPKV